MKTCTSIATTSLKWSYPKISNHRYIVNLKITEMHKLAQLTALGKFCCHNYGHTLPFCLYQLLKCLICQCWVDSEKHSLLCSLLNYTTLASSQVPVRLLLLQTNGKPAQLMPTELNITNDSTHIWNKFFGQQFRPKIQHSNPDYHLYYSVIPINKQW
jgi:hypothetical protein